MISILITVFTLQPCDSAVRLAKDSFDMLCRQIILIIALVTNVFFEKIINDYLLCFCLFHRSILTFITI